MLCKVNAFCGKRRTARGKTFCRHPFFFVRTDGKTRKSMRRSESYAAENTRVLPAEYSSTCRKVRCAAAHGPFRPDGRLHPFSCPASLPEACAGSGRTGNPQSGTAQPMERHRQDAPQEADKQNIATIATRFGGADGRAACIFIHFQPRLSAFCLHTMGKSDEMQGKRPFY